MGAGNGTIEYPTKTVPSTQCCQTVYSETAFLKEHTKGPLKSLSLLHPPQHDTARESFPTVVREDQTHCFRKCFAVGSLTHSLTMGGNNQTQSGHHMCCPYLGEGPRKL